MSSHDPSDPPRPPRPSVAATERVAASLHRPMALIVMGVSGSGKTTIAAMLAGRLHWHFADADDFHPPANIAKMHAGIPLTDEDRWPWLRAIAAAIASWLAAGESGVIACSALKRSYRRVLIGDRPDVRLIYLKGSRALIGDRMAARHDHFMPLALLDSQFATLEEPVPDEHALVISIDPSPAAIVDTILARLAEERDAG